MIIGKLKQFSESDKLSLIIRHGDRDKIPQGSFGNEVMLNDDGVRNSIAFGKELSSLKLNKVFTSPIGRCVQTAEAIATGYGSNIEIIETKALGAPGLHISDEKVAGEFFLKHGFDEMYNRFINEMEIPGIPSINEVNSLVSSYITENTNDTGLTIFVTHDMLIAFYHYSINKKVYTKESWVKYLSGLLLKNVNYEK